jgi:predicted dehydrogenase
VLLGEVEHLSAELQKRNPAVAGEDTATILLRHTSGAVSLVECSYQAKRLPDQFPETLLEIEGDEGSIVTRIGSRIDITAGGEVTTIDADPPVLPWAERPWHVAQESVLTTNRHMLKRFQAGEDADTSGADNLKTYALVEAAYESAATGRAVKPPVESLP